MSKTITIRADRALVAALAKRAKAEHQSVSEIVREILAQALIERPLVDKVGRLRGSLRVAESRGAWRRQIRERNWRP
jgi:predicted transcriptional regulator